MEQESHILYNKLNKCISVEDCISRASRVHIKLQKRNFSETFDRITEPKVAEGRGPLF